MDRFTIRDIETLTEVKASTLRTWGQRYPLLIPSRKESFNRYYDRKNLKKLLHLSTLYSSGFPIARLARLTQQGVAELVKKVKVEKAPYQILINQLFEATLDFQEQGLISALNIITEGIGFKNCIADVCYPFLVKISQLSSACSLIPSMKQFSVHVIQHRIIAETEKLVYSDPPKLKLILFSPMREPHELPLSFINYLMKLNGWQTIYLGTNINPYALEPIIRSLPVNCLFMHFTAIPGDDNPDAYLEQICKKFKNEKIIISGEGIQKMQRSFTNLTVLRTDQQIYDFIEKKQPHFDMGHF